MAAGRMDEIEKMEVALAQKGSHQSDGVVVGTLRKQAFNFKNIKRAPRIHIYSTMFLPVRFLPLHDPLAVMLRILFLALLVSKISRSKSRYSWNLEFYLALQLLFHRERLRYIEASFDGRSSVDPL